ncbi:MAG TPA: pseudouridine-5'-phosphate glycosidase, partial [Mesotoga infera]|nr:pseudouridine-5'-phosphate glycosidase [Mesotoga infera]
SSSGSLPSSPERRSVTREKNRKSSGSVRGSSPGPRQEGISGKTLTPYLLGKLALLSGGKTLDANISLLINNAALGGLIAANSGEEL